MPPPTDQLTFDIAIVGLGPVGATLANILGQYELSTIILERDPETHHLPRAVAFDDEVMRIFQSIELANEINAIVEVVRERILWTRTGKFWLIGRDLRRSDLMVGS